MFKTILEAMILVALVIVFSLKSYKAALIPLVTIPISLIGSFSIMLALGFTGHEPDLIDKLNLEKPTLINPGDKVLFYEISKKEYLNLM